MYSIKKVTIFMILYEYVYCTNISTKIICYIYIFFSESLEYRIKHYTKKGKLKLECKDK